uniref:Splicing factor subunit n=1 Tax=Chromera velia CCMP2878 TaxID=1169474 RepID=A0A0G4HNP6_9ALVE|mmetsp:Transcript_2900/g.5963  ORF Transcript_2900/g.5963 Transcript_2900/m.5963 type:complete len:88 (+) Transcript_2900:239-502(+)|eukprot:Cvel_29606.t1-p1 / transcript=Cvel_29606.t1 / gene=Cvel_29606 / organism=Chromera_velia_CCMP2878 / gene_product=Probable splicing factor 3B subunit 5, putative / transcript_product=Probable splicing factor 3B subunit 5, putative / location=Cvel_scaffold4080:1066-3381(+) / protein_length=87 / sequence_SO=supercontig / SO=protein_coding / is_pseudo=false
MSGYDRYNIHAQMEHLQSKYHGTGTSETSKWEWAANIQRDTAASHLGSHSRLLYFATVENESIARIKYRMLNSMARPCGPPPRKLED